MYLLRLLLASPSPRFLTMLNQIFARGWRRRVTCLALIFGLLIVPDVGYGVSAATELAVQVAKETVATVPVAVEWFNRLLRRSTKPARRETLADRIAYVARIQITPRKFVGYQGQSVSFTALPLNSVGEIVQGVRFDWESSNTDKVQIDDVGNVTFLQPGLARITCRAGAISASAPVLVRPGSRWLQTDLEWRLDQDALVLSGTTTTGLEGSSDSRPVAALFDWLAPTALAQGGTSYTNNDFPYDELWSEPRNLVGSPRNRATETTRAAAVLPESNNFVMTMPLISLGGRGLAAGLTLYYNSRVWFRHGSAITFDAIESRPSPGFSLGFGRLVTYGPTNALKYLWVSADGTRHYLGQGGSASQTVTLNTNDGSHITYVGNAAGGGALYSNDGSKIDIYVINNRLLPSRITDSNGNYITIAYKSFSCDPNCENCACPIYYPPLTLDYVTDTMGRIIQCNYDTNNNLTSITAPDYGGTAQQPMTRTIAQFDYESRSISSSLFSGLTVENRPTQSMNFLKHIYMPATQTGYKFTYSAFGMAYNVSMRRQMSINGSGVISDGIESSSLAFNYQTGSTPALSDAPAFTQRTESAVNAPTATYSYASSTDSFAQEKTYTITRPDNSIINLIRSTNPSSIASGLLVRGEIKNGGGTLIAKSVTAYANDPGGQPQVASIISYDDATPTANQAKEDFDYHGLSV